MLQRLKSAYRVGFDFRGLALFLLIMIPNFIWFFVPAPRDILRLDSKTPSWDLAASCFQVLLVFSLCAVKHVSSGALSYKRISFWLAVVFCGSYFLGWLLYYRGIAVPAVIFSLCLFPCASFFAFAWNRKNLFAMVFSVLFALCHLAGTIINFLL